MAYFFVAIVIAVLIYAMAKIAGGGGYEDMTSEEFEAEAKRGSRMSGTVVALQKIVDPGHRVEYVQEQKEMVSADGAESGDRPETGPADPIEEKTE